MPSKYKQKLPRAKTKQDSPAKVLIMRVEKLNYATCTNCGRSNHLADAQYSKCFCGGVCQTYPKPTQGNLYYD